MKEVLAYLPGAMAILSGVVVLVLSLGARRLGAGRGSWQARCWGSA